MDVEALTREVLGQGQGFFPVQRAAASQQGVEGFTLVPGHLQVSGAVGLETADHPHHVRVLGTGDGAAFFQEGIEALAEAGAFRRIVGLQDAVLIASDPAGRHELLKRERGVENRVGHQVGDARRCANQQHNRCCLCKHWRPARTPGRYFVRTRWDDAGGAAGSARGADLGRVVFLLPAVSPSG